MEEREPYDYPDRPMENWTLMGDDFKYYFATLGDFEMTVQPAGKLWAWFISARSVDFGDGGYEDTLPAAMAMAEAEATDYILIALEQ